ncbi:MAG: hypothetical protein ABR538_09575 [Candidatus Binatia bacterium]
MRLAYLSKNLIAGVWRSEGGRDGDAWGIFGALFDRRLRRIGDEFQINLRHTEGVQFYPTIASTNDGFVVAWYDLGNDRDSPQLISAQRFDAAGHRLGEEIDLAVPPNDYGFYPEAASLNGERKGDVVLVWDSFDGTGNGSGFDIAARFIGRAGAVSDRTILNASTARDEGNPSVAATADGYIVTWTGYDASGSDVFARRFLNSGAPLGDEFRVNTYTDRGQFASVIAVSPEGSFVVVWTSGDRHFPDLSQDGDDNGLYAQAYAANGTRIGEEIQVSTETKGRQGTVLNTTSISFVNNTDFVVVWDDAEPGRSIWVYGRRFRLSPDRRLCGDSVGADLTVRAADALGVLRASVGLSACDLCSCDADGSGAMTSTDAQVVLRHSVGLGGAMVCPACG